MGDRVKGNKAKSKVIKIMNVKLKGKDEFTREIIGGGVEVKLEWVLNLCNIPFQS